MKYVIAVVALINGLWMLIDGVYVLANGKYIGPEKPGPWTFVFALIGIDVFRLGPIFVLFGLAWLIFSAAFVAETAWARILGLMLSILTLWYLPFGTLISLIVLTGLLFFVKG